MLPWCNSSKGSSGGGVHGWQRGSCGSCLHTELDGQLCCLFPDIHAGYGFSRPDSWSCTIPGRMLYFAGRAYHLYVEYTQQDACTVRVAIAAVKPSLYVSTVGFSVARMRAQASGLLA